MILGNDLRTVDPATLALITHDEIIALNQDALGMQASVVATAPGPGRHGERCVNRAANVWCDAWAKAGACAYDPSYMWESCQRACNHCHYDGGLHVWAGPLSGNRTILALFNRSNATAPITGRWRDAGLHPTTACTVRDVWAKKDLPSPRTQLLNATVQAYDTRLYVLTPVRTHQGRVKASRRL